jgi:N-acetylmuramoyl-L-alanine amidase CwlA
MIKEKFMRKVTILFGLVCLLALVACGKKDEYSITLPQEGIDLYINETHELSYTIMNKGEVVQLDVTISIETNGVLELTDKTVRALKEGTNNVIVSLKEDPSISKTLKVVVGGSLSVTHSGGNIMFVRDNLTLTGVDKADKTGLGITWTSNNTLVASVNNGVVTALKIGTVIITATSKTNNVQVKTTITIQERNIDSVEVPPLTQEINLFEDLTLVAKVFPANANQNVTWVSSNPNIAIINENGNVETLKEGEVTMTATSIIDESKSATITFNIVMDPIKVLASLNVKNPIKQYVTTFGYNPDQRFQWVYGSVSQYFNDELNLIERIVPINENQYAGKVATSDMITAAEGLKKVRSGILHPETKYIVYHDTGNHTPGADANMHANYMVGSDNANNRARSWHYTVDDKNVIHHIPDNEVSWQGDSFDAYAKSIGIETCVNFGSDLFTTWQRTAKLMAKILVEQGLTVDAVKQHYDFSKKNCPQTLRMSNLYDDALELVRAEYIVLTILKDYNISFTSLNPNYVDDRGRVIKLPETATRVGYVVNISKGTYNESTILYSTLPGADNTTEVKLVGTDNDILIAKNFDLQVSKISKNVTFSDTNAVSNARNAYNTLTGTQKQLVTTVTLLVSKELALHNLLIQARAKEVDDLILSLPENLVLADENLIIDARNSYNLLTNEEKALIKFYDYLLDKEAKIEGIKYPDLGKINKAIEKMPSQIVFDYKLPTDNGITWSYKAGQDESFYNLTTGKYLKVSYEAKPITLIAKCNSQSKEVVINFGLLKVGQKAIFATGAVVPKLGGQTSEGMGTVAEQEGSVGFGGVSITVGNKVYFVGYRSFITLTAPSSGNQLTINNLRPYGSDPDATAPYNQSLIKGVAYGYKGTGTLYYNSSSVNLTFDPSFTYGRNNSTGYGYGKIVFSPNQDGTLTVNPIWTITEGVDTNTGTSGALKTLKPGEYLWCPHIFEANLNYGTWLMQEGSGGPVGVLKPGTIISITKYKTIFN